MTYRIERACELLNLNSDDGDDMLELHLALKLHEMRPYEKQRNPQNRR